MNTVGVSRHPIKVFPSRFKPTQRRDPRTGVITNKNNDARLFIDEGNFFPRALSVTSLFALDGEVRKYLGSIRETRDTDGHLRDPIVDAPLVFFPIYSVRPSTFSWGNEGPIVFFGLS